MARAKAGGLLTAKHAKIRRTGQRIRKGRREHKKKVRENRQIGFGAKPQINNNLKK